MSKKYILFRIEIRTGEYEHDTYSWFETDGTEKDIEKKARYVIMGYSYENDLIEGEGVYLSADLFTDVICIKNYYLYDSKEEVANKLLEIYKGVK